MPQTLAASQPLPLDVTPPNLLTPSHFPALQSILEANILQRVRADYNYDTLVFQFFYPLSFLPPQTGKYS